jgi:hypothetical protein
VALRLTGLTNLLYEVAKRLRTTNSLWPVYSKGLPLELTAERAWLIHTISFFEAFVCAVARIPEVLEHP